jgi:hypothetical protein
MKYAKIVFWVLVLSGLVQAVYPLEVYIKPGAGIYNDSVGLNGGVGFRGRLKNILRIENPRFFSGVSYGISYAGMENITFLNHFFTVDFGYDFILPVLDNRISIAPVIGIGGVYGSILSESGTVSEEFGFALIPSAEAKFALTDSLNLGINAGYPLAFIYEGMIRYVELGVFFSYSFK